MFNNTPAQNYTSYLGVRHKYLYQRLKVYKVIKHSVKSCTKLFITVISVKILTKADILLNTIIQVWVESK